MEDNDRFADDFSFDMEEFDYDTYEPYETEQTDIITESEENILGNSNLRRRRTRSGGKKKKALVVLIAVGSILLGTAIGLFCYSLTTIDESKVMNNVYIENIEVSGLGYDETLAAVNAAYLLEDIKITITDGEGEFTINGADIGLTALPEETAHKAFEYCKSGNILLDGIRASILLFKEHVIVPAPQVDDELLDAKLTECGNALKGERKQHYAEFNIPDIATVKSGCTGFDGNISVAREQVLRSMNREVFNKIRVSFETAPPDAMTIENLDLLIYKDPVDARYEINGNDVTVVPSETGRYIDKEAVAPLVAQIYEGCEPVSVPYFVSDPAVTEQVLSDKLFSSTLASYSTSYGGSTWNRCQNVARAASLISGKVIAAGEVFSFNDTVGRRTTANGFYTAKEYINGESVDGIGGGTCQVSSTLYSAVLYADLGIVERLNHMMAVGYIPLGQDATVSDGGVDFKFRNTTEYPIKIVTYTNGSTITVNIIGTAWEPARRVSISNSSSAAGENTVVRSTRYVYSGDTLISTDTLNSSTYMPHKKTVAE